MAYRVYVLKEAQRDIRDIYEYIGLNDAAEKAEHVYQNIEKIIEGLRELPGRGVYPMELAEQGITDFRELFFKPYRIVYRIEGKKVFVVLVVDGRRNVAELLRRRLLSR